MTRKVRVKGHLRKVKGRKAQVKVKPHLMKSPKKHKKHYKKRKKK